LSQALPVKRRLRHSVKAAAEIFLEHGEFIRTVIRLNVKDAHEAHDFYHDFFLSIVANPIPSYVTNIRSYLYRAIVNDIVDYRRHLIVHQSAVETCGIYSRTGVLPDTPDTVVMDKEQALKLFNLIETRLSPTEAEAVTLRFRDNYTNAEAARRMKIKPKTLSRYVSVGLEKLRQLVSDGEGYNDEDI